MKKDREFYGKLRELMVPIAVQSFLLAAVSAGDSAMLGFVDETAMAAVSLAGNIQFVENLFLAAVVCGATILTAQYWGKGDRGTVERIFGLILRYALVISLVFCLAAFAFPRQLMGVFTNDESLVEIGGEYVRLAALSYLLTGITQCYLCVMKTTGQAKQTAAISSFALGLDTVLNALFIFGLHMGAAGAALTTTISRFVELGIVVAYSRNMAARPRFGKLSPALHRDFLKCGIPHFINSMAWGLGTALYSVIIGHLGAAVTAAYSVANIVRQLALALCHGLGSGGEVMLANVLGSGDLVKGKEYGSRLSRLSILCGLVCALLCLVFGALLARFMTLSPEVRQDLGIMTWISAFYMLAACVNVVVICGVFTAGGDTAFDAYSVAVTMWCLILPLAAAGAFLWKWEPLAVYLVLSLDEAVKIPWVYAHYKKYKWLNNMTREEFDREIQKGLDDIKAGRVYSAGEAEEKIVKELGL